MEIRVAIGIYWILLGIGWNLPLTCRTHVSWKVQLTACEGLEKVAPSLIAGKRGVSCLPLIYTYGLIQHMHDMCVIYFFIG